MGEAARAGQRFPTHLPEIGGKVTGVAAVGNFSSGRRLPMAAHPGHCYREIFSRTFFAAT
jgi:hypothetical protein